MLEQSQVHALLEARHGDPFAALGLHADAAGRLWLRALLPGARAVSVVEAEGGRALTALAQREPGFFEAAIPRRRKRFDYRLAVQWQDGGSGEYADAYA